MSDALEAQLDALGNDLLALNESEAKKALAEAEQEIARLRHRIERLRLAMQLRATWLESAQSSDESSAVTAIDPPGDNASANGSKKPKTRTVLLQTFDSEPTRDFTTKELLSILREHGITISAEGLRLALRRLIGEKLIFKPQTGRYQSRRNAREDLFAD